MKDKSLVLVSLVIGLVALVGCMNTELTGKAVADTKEKVSVRLPIPIVEPGFSIFYLAQDKGYYAEENLDVTLNAGSSEANPIKMVVSDADEFGVIGGPDTLLVARSKGHPVVAIAVVHQDSNFPVLLTLKESNLTKLEDLDRKKIGFFYGHISTDVLHNLLNKYDIQREEVNVGFDYSQLIAGQIDAEWAFRTTAGVSLPAKGIEVNTISPKDYGITTHGHTIFTTEDMIENHPEEVERFLRATLEGIKHMKKYPDDAVNAALTRNPKLDVGVQETRVELYNQVMSDTSAKRAGYMDLEMFQETYDRLVEEDVIAEEFDVGDAFTTEFLEKVWS